MDTSARAATQPLTRRRVLAAIGVAAAGVTSLAACTNDRSPSRNGPGASSGRGTSKLVVTTPAADATDVPAGTEIVFAATGVNSAQVTLTDSAGRNVPGAMHPDGGGWLPDKALQYGQRYTATVTGIDDDGRAVTATSRFTTMNKPDKLVSFVSFLPDDAVVGVGMPLILRLSRALSKLRNSGPSPSGVCSCTPCRYRKAHGPGTATRNCTGGPETSGNPEPESPWMSG
jgi:hypothetical protein